MSQAREAAGLDLEDVQFTLTMSPVWYLFFSPRISGPSESGKSAKPNSLTIRTNMKPISVHMLTYSI